MAPNAQTAQAATKRDAVPLDDILLLGLIKTPEGDRALLRYSGGKIHTVAKGDRTRAGRVLAIGEDRVILLGQGKQHILRMPRG